MRPQLSFNDHYKDLILEYDFEYFLKKDIQANNYSEQEVEAIYSTYKTMSDTLSVQAKENKKQFLNHLHGQVQLMFTGGFLPALFRIDGFTRQSSFLDFNAVGENWAYFVFWQKLERKKRRRKKIWKLFLKSHTVLKSLLKSIS